MALGCAETSKLIGYLVCADARGTQQGRAAQQAHRGAAGRQGGPAAAGVKAGVGDPTVGTVGVDRDRDTNEVAAGGTAGGAGEGVLGYVDACERRLVIAAQL